MYYVGTTVTMKMKSNDKIGCGNIFNDQKINVLRYPQQFDWSRSTPTTFASWSIWVIGM